MIPHARLISLFVFLLLMASCAAPPAVPTVLPVTEETSTPAGEPAASAEETTAPSSKKKVLGMVTLVSHPSLDSIQQGVKDQLANAGFADGENITILQGNAEGDFATLSTIVEQFLDAEVDLIVATTTPALQAAYNLTQDSQGPPIFFNGVSNPYTAGIAAAPDDHPAWVIGNQLLDPVADAMDLMREVLPDLKMVGLVYNPTEANAVYLVEVAKTAAAERGITLETAAVSNSSEVQTAAESLIARGIDAYLAINDNTVTSGFAALVQTANENDLPLFGTSASMPKLGAAASYGIDPYQEGLDSGQMVVDYLNGNLDIAKATIQVQDAVLLTVNPAAASEQGIELPQAVMERADNVIQ